MPFNPNTSLVYQTKFNYTIEIGGVVRAGFMKAGAITQSTEVISIREGGNPFDVKQPGTSSFAPVKLERGLVTSDFDLIAWAEQVANSRTQTGLGDNAFKKDIDIVQRNAARVVQRRTRLKRCWVSEYELGDLDTSASEVQMEAITLVFEAIENIPI